MKKTCFIFVVVCLMVLFYLPSLAQDSKFERIVGDRKYFVGNPAKGWGRNYIVRNPMATLPPPSGIPLAKTDSTYQVCCLWGEDQGLAYFNDDSFDPKVSVVHDSIHIVWWQQFSSNKISRLETFYIRSMDGGDTWQDSLVLSQVDEMESVLPDIAVVGQNVYVVWRDWYPSQERGIYFRKSMDGGQTWSPVIGIDLAGPDYYGYYGSTVAGRGSEVYVAYGKEIDSDGSLRFKKSIDYGESWGSEITVSEAAVGGYPPKLVVNSGGLHLVAQHGWNNSVEIFYNKSTDFGGTWQSYIPISELDDVPSQWPSIAADDSGNVYITWFDYKYSPYAWTGDIFLRKSTDNGESWLPIVSLTVQHKAVASDVFAKNNTVHVVWEDERHGSNNYEIYYRRSEDQGESWFGEERLTDAPGNSNNPRVTCNSNRIDVTWTDARDFFHRDLFYKNGYRYTVGDVNSDFIIDGSDVVYLINFLFIYGPSPFVVEAGDVNQDEHINVADIVYLINYLFCNGPPPMGC